MNPRHHQLEELMRTDGRRLHALLYRLTLSLDTADDLLQELCVRFMRGSLAHVEQPAAYATRTAIHLAMDRRRRRREAHGDHTEPVDSAATPFEQAHQRETLERVLEAIEELREPLQEIVVLRYIEGQAYESIAASLKKTPQQIRGLAHKAIQTLRARLRPIRTASNGSVSYARDE